MTLVLPYFSNTEKIKMFDPEGKSVFELCVNDIDGDGVCDEEDNCWYVLNPDQADSNDNCPEPPYEIDPICGDACEILTLNLLPDPVWAEKTVTATISCSVDCSGKTAYVGRGEKMVTVCYNYTCLANGCSCTFTAPKLLSTESIETYYARIDLDGNKIYDETEIDSNDLTIYCNAKGVSCSSTETCCAGAYCISGTCQYPSGPGCGKNCLMK